MLKNIEQISGVKEDDLKVLVCLLLQIPVSFVYRKIKSCKTNNNLSRKLFGLLITLISFLYCFELTGIVLVFIYTCLTYFLSLTCTNVKQTIIISCLYFAFLTCINIWRFIVDYEGNSNNFSIALMILTPKLIFFNWFILKMQGQQTKIEEISLFDYLSYLYNYIGSMTCPTYSYEEFDVFINQTVPETQINYKEIKINVFQFFICFLIALYSLNYFDFKQVETKEFGTRSIFFRIFIILIYAILKRARYYSAWLLAELMAIIVNFRSGCSGYKNYLKNINIQIVEFRFGIKERIEQWNISIQQWLKNCFYLPIVEKLKIQREYASILTFFISAFWHGFYPSYYLMGISLSITSSTEKIMYKHQDIFKIFPSFGFRILLDMQAIVFSKFIIKEMYGTMKNIWGVFVFNIFLYIFCSLIVKFKKRRRDDFESKNKHE